MNPLIPINALLIEREDQWVHVETIERQINEILGQPYPFKIDVDLPSRQRRKKPKRKVASKASAAIRLRKLDPATESAYRISYIQQNEEHTEIHFENKPLMLLLNTPLQHLHVICIETIRATENQEWESVEQLYEASPEKKQSSELFKS